MTSRLVAQCSSCRHWVSPLTQAADNLSVEPPQVCAAFPGGIPDAIWWNEVDHRLPQDGDHGVRWAARDGASFPENQFGGGSG